MTLVDYISILILVPLFTYIVCEKLGLYDYSTEKNVTKIKVITIGIAIIIAIFCVYIKSKGWNGGFCPQCNSPWKLIDVERARHSLTQYIYECQKCFDIFVK